eukprot:3281754-Pleurochrysis_carterae.AAC.1
MSKLAHSWHNAENVILCISKCECKLVVAYGDIAVARAIDVHPIGMAQTAHNAHDGAPLSWKCEGAYKEDNDD